MDRLIYPPCYLRVQCSAERRLTADDQAVGNRDGFDCFQLPFEHHFDNAIGGRERLRLPPTIEAVEAHDEAAQTRSHNKRDVVAITPAPTPRKRCEIYLQLARKSVMYS